MEDELVSNYTVNQNKSFFPDSGIFMWLLLAILFASAFSIRLYNIDSPPMDFHPERQHHSALLARALYAETFETVQSTERNAIIKAKPKFIEVPFMEYISAYLYNLFDGENLIIPRLLSVMFWFIAGAILYCLGRDLVSHDAAIISLAFFFFLPFGVSASRSFQPDPLMVMMFVASIFSIFKHFTRSSGYSLAIVSVLSALAILVKPVCIFPIFGAFIAMKIVTRGANKLPVDRELTIFGVVSVFPSLLYYGYGIFIAGFLEGHVQSKFQPELYLEAYYWKGWVKMVSRYIGIWPVAISIIGVLLIHSIIKRAFLVGLWVGYGIFGLVFTYHIHTHNYYSLILVPIVSLTIGVAASIIFTKITFNTGVWGRFSRLVIWIVFVISFIWSARTSIYLLNDSGFDKEIALYEEIGENINHSDNTIFLDMRGGEILQYYGKFAGIDWISKVNIDYMKVIPKTLLKGEELLNKIISERYPEYFIVISLDEFDEQEDLKIVLDSRYPILVENTDYIIYDLRESNE